MLICCDGLESMSNRWLAVELKCEAMLVYHHVPSKGHLLDSVADLLMGKLIGQMLDFSALDRRKVLATLFIHW